MNILSVFMNQIKTIQKFLFLLATIIFLSMPTQLFATTFTTSDLAGTWEFYANSSGGTWEGWSYGTFVIDSTGTLTSGSGTTSDGDSDTYSGSLSISSSGNVTAASLTTGAGTTVTSSSGQMDSNKSMVSMVFTMSDGEEGIVTIVKTGASFTASDLAGTWKDHSISSGGAWEGWDHSTVVIDSSGNGTSSWTDSDGDSGTDNYSISISSDGAVTVAGLTAFYSQMDSTKSMIPYVTTDPDDGTEATSMLVKTGASFTTSDLAGTWEFYANSSGGAWEGWSYGTFVIDSTGTLTSGSGTDSDGDSDTYSGSLSISSSGNVTAASLTTGSGTTVTSSSGQMDSNKSMVSMVFTMSDGEEGIVTIVKSATPDSTAPSNTTATTDFINAGGTTTDDVGVTLTLTATDATGVTGYYASETATTPTASSSWVAVTSTTDYSATVSYTLGTSQGEKTVYVWFKDAAGNISSKASDTITSTFIPTLSEWGIIIFTILILLSGIAMLRRRGII